MTPIIKETLEDETRGIKLVKWTDGGIHLHVRGDKMEFPEPNEFAGWVETLLRLWRLIRDDE